MTSRRLQNGLTLVEIIITAAIVAILAGLVFTTVTSIDARSKENLCRATLETLNTALRQFRDFGYEYHFNISDDDERDFYRSLKFPPDCNDYIESDAEAEIGKLLDLDVEIASEGLHDPNESGIAVMCFFLSQVPDCRETLAGIDAKLLKSDHDDEKYLTITVDVIRLYPWQRVVDPWKTPLRYDYYDENEADWDDRKQTIRNFPLLTSAGPDKEFDTDDDITNRDKTKAAEYQP